MTEPADREPKRVQPLTIRQERYAEARAAGAVSQADAVRKAGYSTLPASVYPRGSRLASSDKVRARIRSLERDRADKARGITERSLDVIDEHLGARKDPEYALKAAIVGATVHEKLGGDDEGTHASMSADETKALVRRFARRVARLALARHGVEADESFLSRLDDRRLAAHRRSQRASVTTIEAEIVRTEIVELEAAEKPEETE